MFFPVNETLIIKDHVTTYRIPLAYPVSQTSFAPVVSSMMLGKFRQLNCPQYSATLMAWNLFYKGRKESLKISIKCRILLDESFLHVKVLRDTLFLKVTYEPISICHLQACINNRRERERFCNCCTLHDSLRELLVSSSRNNGFILPT